MLLRSTQKIWEKFIENFLHKSSWRFASLHCSRLPGQLIMQNQSQRLCSMWHLVELLSSPLLPVFLPRRGQFGVKLDWLVERWLWIDSQFLMIIPLMKCWSKKSWWTSRLHFAYSIHGKHHPCAKKAAWTHSCSWVAGRTSSVVPVVSGVSFQYSVLGPLS